MSDTSVKEPGPGGTATPTHGNMQASTPNGTGAATYFRKGFGLKSEIQSELDSDYTGHLVDLLKDREYSLLLRSRARGRLRLSGEKEVPGSYHLSGG